MLEHRRCEKLQYNWASFAPTALFFLVNIPYYQTVAPTELKYFDHLPNERATYFRQGQRTTHHSKLPTHHSNQLPSGLITETKGLTGKSHVFRSSGWAGLYAFISLLRYFSIPK